MKLQPTFEPMAHVDLDWIVEHEQDLHAFPWTRGNFSDALDAGYSAWVARVDRSPVAYAVMLLVLDEAHLLNLSVVRAMHRRGLASACLVFLFDLARKQGASQFFLEVRPTNMAALELYRRHGFEPIGRRRNYYPAPGGGREDAHVMRADLR